MSWVHLPAELERFICAREGLYICVVAVRSTMIWNRKITKPLEEFKYILCVFLFPDTIFHFPIFLTRCSLAAQSEVLVLRLQLFPPRFCLNELLLHLEETGFQRLSL